jgi:hypothetical protein
MIRRVSGIDVECITGDEKEEGFFFFGICRRRHISIASVHPIREDIIDGLLKKRNADKTIISEMVKKGELCEFQTKANDFTERKFRRAKTVTVLNGYTEALPRNIIVEQHKT